MRIGEIWKNLEISAKTHSSNAVLWLEDFDVSIYLQRETWASYKKR